MVLGLPKLARQQKPSLRWKGRLILPRTIVAGVSAKTVALLLTKLTICRWCRVQIPITGM